MSVLEESYKQIKSIIDNLPDDQYRREAQSWLRDYMSRHPEITEKREPMTIHESILVLRHYATDLKSEDGACIDVNVLDEALSVVCNYAENCYIDHSEEVGKVAILEIDEIKAKMKKKWNSAAKEWLFENVNKYLHTVNQYGVETTVVYGKDLSRDFVKYMKKII